VHDSQRSLGQWTVLTSEAKTGVESVSVRRGETIDFVTDSVGNPNHDSFNWTVRVRYEDGAKESFESEKQLPTPRPAVLDAWQLLAQAILASNEFAFID